MYFNDNCYDYRELLSQHPENLRTLMTHTILNELSNSRNPNNMTLISVMFQHDPEQSAKVGLPLATGGLLIW